jgi:hypothetical protein
MLVNSKNDAKEIALKTIKQKSVLRIIVFICLLSGKLIAFLKIWYYVCMSDLKILQIFSSRIEAEIARGFLQSNGINAIIISDDAGSMYPAQDIVSGVRLLVGEDDFQGALELLDSLEVETQEDSEQ